MLFLDGVYTETNYGKTRFQRANAPDQQELVALVHTISHRVAGLDARPPWRAPFGRTLCVQIRSRRICLEREGILNLEEGDEDPMQQVLGCSVSYRIAIGPQQGRKVFTLQTIPAWEDDDGFS